MQSNAKTRMSGSNRDGLARERHVDHQTRAQHNPTLMGGNDATVDALGVTKIVSIDHKVLRHDSSDCTTALRLGEVAARVSLPRSIHVRFHTQPAFARDN